MKRPVLALLLAAVAVPSAAAPPGPAPSPLAGAPITIQLDGIPTSALVVMLLRDIMRVPYVISPDVLSDRRATSVRLVIPRNEIPERVVAYLRRAGFSVDLQGGTVYVARSGSRGASYSLPAGPVAASSSVPQGSPVDLGNAQMPVAQSAPSIATDPSYSAAPSVEAPQDLGILAYVPAHRPPAYFTTVMAPLLPELVFGARGEVHADTNRGLIDGSNLVDVLIMSGPPETLEKARRLVSTLDRPRQLVAVKAVVMQVQTAEGRGSALSVLADLAGGRFSAGSFAGDPPASQFVRIGTNALHAVLSAVRTDDRFKVVATPNLTALSGAAASMNAGAQVPTIGAVSVTEGGVPVQSVVYRDSGITLTVRPVVRGDLIELAVEEERSTFVKTTTGVEDSPTLQRSSVNAQVVLRSGESVVLAGLNEQSDSNRREGLFFGLLGSRSHETIDSELLVLLQAELVPTADVLPGQFLTIHDPSAEESEDDATDPLAPLPRRARTADLRQLRANGPLGA